MADGQAASLLCRHAHAVDKAEQCWPVDSAQGVLAPQAHKGCHCGVGGRQVSQLAGAPSEPARGGLAAAQELDDVCGGPSRMPLVT